MPWIWIIAAVAILWLLMGVVGYSIFIGHLEQLWRRTDAPEEVVADQRWHFRREAAPGIVGGPVYLQAVVDFGRVADLETKYRF